MQPQKLCLKWNNHTVNLLSVLGSFQQKDILVDVTISCEGQNIKAHKMVLSACSPYFQSIFLENPCQHPIVIINGIKYEDITAILNFMYKGEVNVSQDGLSSFLQAAEALKVKGLAEVCGERKSTNSINQEAQHNEQSRPQRTDTPPRKKHRNRKRSLSDSNKSDDEGTARKHHREPSSPEVHELSGDESFTGDNTSNGPPFHSSPRVPQNIYSRSHQSSSNLGGEDDDDYEVEPSKLLEQTLTTDNVSMNNSSSDNNLRIERIMGNATEIESSNIQEPESPPDIKPIIDYGESSAGPSEGNLMLYSEHSQPGPSSVQDGSLLHDNSHAQDKDTNKRVVKDTVKKAVKGTVKSAVKGTIKPAVKSTAKPATRSSVKSAAKGTVKPAAKSSVKPTAKSSVKPVVKSPVKPAAVSPVKPAAVSPVKPAAVSPVKPAAVSPVKSVVKSPAKPDDKDTLKEDVIDIVVLNDKDITELDGMNIVIQDTVTQDDLGVFKQDVKEPVTDEGMDIIEQENQGAVEHHDMGIINQDDKDSTKQDDMDIFDIFKQDELIVKIGEKDIVGSYTVDKGSNNKNKYSCLYCPYTTFQLECIKSHQVTHIGAHPFQCRFCEKTFAQTSSLRLHERCIHRK